MKREARQIQRGRRFGSKWKEPAEVLAYTWEWEGLSLLTHRELSPEAGSMPWMVSEARTGMPVHRGGKGETREVVEKITRERMRAFGVSRLREAVEKAC